MATETAEKTKEEVLAELEKEFADRYTLKDKEFERYKQNSLATILTWIETPADPGLKELVLVIQIFVLKNSDVLVNLSFLGLS